MSAASYGPDVGYSDSNHMRVCSEKDTVSNGSHERRSETEEPSERRRRRSDSQQSQRRRSLRGGDSDSDHHERSRRGRDRRRRGSGGGRSVSRSRSSSRGSDPKKRPRRSVSTRTDDNSRPLSESGNASSSAIPRRKRRTGWDAPPQIPPVAAAVAGAAAAAAALTPTASLLSMTPTTTGFTASLAGKSPEEAATLAATLQLKTATSQMCRIYVGSLDYSLTDQDIRQVFSAFGPITSIDMPKEGARSKGFCFIEYATPEAAEMAISTMPGFNLKGRAIKVGRPTALGGGPSVLPMMGIAKAGGVNAAEAGQIAAAMLLAKNEGASAGLPTHVESQNRIYVGCVPYSFTSDDIKQIFDVFGKILSCQLIPSNERPGTHRGYGFIEYSTFEEAKLAIETMNDFPVAGKVLKVNHATALRGMGFPSSLPPNPPPGTAALLAGSFAAPSATGANTVPVASLPYVVPSMASEGASAVAAMSEQVTPPTGDVSKSPVLLLSDMVDVTEANDDLKEEIRQECQKYGKITDVSMAVDATKNAVRIFVVFEAAEHAAAAVPMLHERWFGGRRIQARQYDETSYKAGRFWF